MPRRLLAIVCALLFLGFTKAGHAQDITTRDLMRLLAAHRGKVVVLNFWATWCGPCMKEMPELARLRAAYPGGRLEIIGISLDYDPDALEAYLSRTPLPYPSLRDQGDVAETFGVTQIPHTFILNPSGRIHASIVGETDAVTLRRHIDPLLAP